MSDVRYNPPIGEIVNLGALNDVDLSTSPTDGQALTYDNASSTWQAGDAPTPSVEMNDLTDAVTSSEASGQMLVWDGAQWRNRTMGGDVTVGSTGLVTVQDDSHNHTEMDNSSGQLVLAASTIGVDVRDGSGDDPTIRLLDSSGAILGQIVLDGTANTLTLTPLLGGTSLVVEDLGTTAEARLTSSGAGPSRLRLQNSEGQVRMVADGDSLFLQINSSPTSDSGWTTILSRGVTAPVVTGSRGGNAALASLLTALDQIFLIDDQTTA